MADTLRDNQDQLSRAGITAIADLTTAEGLVSANGWDGLTPAQRKAIALGLVRQQRAIIRYVLNLLDSPS